MTAFSICRNHKVSILNPFGMVLYWGSPSPERTNHVLRTGADISIHAPYLKVLSPCHNYLSFLILIPLQHSANHLLKVCHGPHFESTCTLHLSYFSQSHLSPLVPKTRGYPASGPHGERTSLLLLLPVQPRCFTSWLMCCRRWSCSLYVFAWEMDLSVCLSGG